MKTRFVLNLITILHTRVTRIFMERANMNFEQMNQDRHEGNIVSIHVHDIHKLLSNSTRFKLV